MSEDPRYCEAFNCLNPVEPVTLANSKLVHPVLRSSSLHETMERVEPQLDQTLRIHNRCDNPHDYIAA